MRKGLLTIVVLSLTLTSARGQSVTEKTESAAEPAVATPHDRDSGLSL